ncbi:hypothetical protein QFC22_005193 [Naganishia vaughanmartiniae]|uniref:Uncharacterized protein n=1 Tax=Naganishia vaughanmartiniae TaxID=1424756 RepID=A0ACC2WXA1_9TREE|nr:hypothetical protein QFC22_005193 [Naganishia vaughanmartiniae]
MVSPFQLLGWHWLTNDVAAGPIVRISPNEVAVNELASVKEVHRIGSGFGKSEWYPIISGESPANAGLFSQRDPKKHAIRRKLFSQPFSKAGIQEWEEMLKDRVNMAIAGMGKMAARDGGVADVLEWWTFMTTDVIAELGFGENFHALETGQPSQYTKDLLKTFILSGLRADFPFLFILAKYLPIPPLQHAVGAFRRLEIYGEQAIAKYRVMEKNGGCRKTLFTNMAEGAIDDKAIAREAQNLIIAGTDTTSVTLTYLVWAVASHPNVKSKLLEEIRQKIHSDTFGTADTEELPYLQAVIQETLRLYGAAPGGLPRLAPAGGRVLSEVFVPEGTVVTTHAYSLHRDANIYADPHRQVFKPERWFSPTQAMKDAFMPFGGGTRVCIGVHLAKFEIALGAITFFLAYPNAQVAPQTTAGDMEFENFFLIAPKSHKCFIKLD